MSSTARTIFTWTLGLSLAACAADSEQAHEPPAAVSQPATPNLRSEATAPSSAESAVDVTVVGGLAPSVELATSATPVPTLAVDAALSAPATQLPGQPSSTPAATPTNTAAPSTPAPATPAPSTPKVAGAIVAGFVSDLGLGAPTLGLGGQGTLGLAAKVRLSALHDGGLPRTLSEVAIDAQGGFSFEVALKPALLIAEALDGADRVLGSVLVGVDASVAGEVLLAAPISAESSLEARLVLRAAACGKASVAQLTALALDTTLLVDAELSTQVAAAISAGARSEGLLDALAKATLSAHRARAATLLDAQIALDGSALLSAELAALIKLNGGLQAALTTQVAVGDLSVQLASELDAAWSAAGAKPEVRARAQVAASLGLGASLRASLRGREELRPLLFSALHAAAKLELQVALPTIDAQLALSGAGAQLLASARLAGRELALDVQLASDVSAIERARVKYLERLHGGRASRGLLGDLLGATSGIVTGLFDTVLGTVADLSEQLDVSLAVALDAQVALGCGGVQVAGEVDLSLQGLVQTLRDFQVDVRALSPELAQSGLSRATADALADLLGTAEIILHVSL